MKNILAYSLSSSRPLISDFELAELLDGTADSRYGKIKRWLAQGLLVRIRRGLYYLAFNKKAEVQTFELAQYIYGPSYISLESALAYHNLIPEAVHTITSVCTKRSKIFHTPFGEFNYWHLPVENFYLDVKLIRNDNEQFLMANPWKAICDYVYCYKKNWLGMQPLVDSLRIDEKDLPKLQEKELIALDGYYHHQRISHFLAGIKRDLNL